MKFFAALSVLFLSSSSISSSSSFMKDGPFRVVQLDYDVDHVTSGANPMDYSVECVRTHKKASLFLFLHQSFLKTFFSLSICVQSTFNCCRVRLGNTRASSSSSHSLRVGGHALGASQLGHCAFPAARGGRRRSPLVVAVLMKDYPVYAEHRGSDALALSHLGFKVASDVDGDGEGEEEGVTHVFSCGSFSAVGQMDRNTCRYDGEGRD